MRYRLHTRMPRYISKIWKTMYFNYNVSECLSVSGGGAESANGPAGTASTGSCAEPYYHTMD